MLPVIKPLLPDTPVSPYGRFIMPHLQSRFVGWPDLRIIVLSTLCSATREISSRASQDLQRK